MTHTLVQKIIKRNLFYIILASAWLLIPAHGMETYIHAITTGNLPLLREQIALKKSLNQDINDVGSPINSALSEAIFNNQNKVLVELIKAGANLEKTHQLQRTALHQAIARHNYSAAQILIDAGAHINAQDDEGTTPLHLAAYTNNPIGQALITAGARVDLLDSFRQTPLHIACDNGNVDIITPLIFAGTPINQQDFNGRTALHKAMASNTDRHFQISSKLILSNASLELRDDENKRPCDLNLAKDSHTIQDFFNTTVPRLRPFLQGLASQELQTIQAILALHIDILHIQDPINGMTPLHFVIRNIGTNQDKNNSWMAIMRTMVARHANVNGQDNNGRTALSYAIEQKNGLVARYLIIHGATVTAEILDQDPVFWVDQVFNSNPTQTETISADAQPK